MDLYDVVALAAADIAERHEMTAEVYEAREEWIRSMFPSRVQGDPMDDLNAMRAEMGLPPIPVAGEAPDADVASPP